MTEFEFERGEILSNLTLIEDHAQKFPCPYCMEKHTSKIIGYAEEIAMGKEGDEKDMMQLAEQARDWRRKIQGLKGTEHSHEHSSDHNPSCTEKIDSCVQKLIEKGEDVNAYAVCKTSVKCP